MVIYSYKLLYHKGGIRYSVMSGQVGAAESAYVIIIGRVPVHIY
jgi:hypothetical protein